MWPGKAKRRTAVMVVIASCIAVGVIGGAAARLSESRMPTESEVRATLAASVRFDPVPGATSVAPDAPIVVRGGKGRLVAVHAVSTSGAIVAGEVVASENEWRSRGVLAYGAGYRVTATVVGPTQVRADATMAFRTLTPAALIGTAVFPWQGLEVGVGQPIVFTLSQPVPSEVARQRLVSRLSVTESQAVAGGWHWFGDRELHFRPRAFWPPGEHVTVRWNFQGWNAGGGAWGAAEGSATFTVGDAHVSIANLATDQMPVTDNGRVIAT